MRPGPGSPWKTQTDRATSPIRSGRWGALFGAGADVTSLGEQTIRDVATTGFRITVDLVAADEVLPAGIGVPEGPFR
ncbi:hypothetical protein [Flindersiella endophytica]